METVNGCNQPPRNRTACPCPRPNPPKRIPVPPSSSEFVGEKPKKRPCEVAVWCVLPTDEVATLLSKEEVVATPTELYYPRGRTGFRFNPPPPHLRHNAPSSTAILAYTSHSREVKEIEHIKRTNKRLHILDCGRERKKSKSGKGKKREEVRFHLLNTLTRVFLFLSCLFFFVYQNSYPSTLNVFPYCKYPSMILSTGSGSPMLSNVNAILACPWI